MNEINLDGNNQNTYPFQSRGLYHPNIYVFYTFYISSVAIAFGLLKWYNLKHFELLSCMELLISDRYSKGCGCTEREGVDVPLLLVNVM